MKVRLVHLMTAAVMLSLFGTSSSTIWHVHPDSAISSIQAGIDSSSHGDTVLVYPETYLENINYHGKSIAVGSLFLTTGDISYISSTLIDGNSAGSVVTFAGGEDSSTVIAGFTIQNGYDIPRGGGIKCNDASPRLINLAIRNNIALSGGGVFCSRASSVGLSGVSISNNLAAYGGGIYCEYDSDASLTNAIITGNQAASLGGASLCYWGPSLSMTNTTVSGNTANTGGAIYCVGAASASLANCILWNNSPEEVYFDSLDTPNVLIVSYSDIQGDSAGIVTNDNATVYWLEGNIDEDPLFIGAGDHPFALQQGSPCIDAGTPDTTGLGLPPWDILGSQRIWDGDGNGSAIIDMGAYEYNTLIDDAIIIERRPRPFLRSYPNPLSSHTTIQYGMPDYAKVSLKVYNPLGQEIAVLADEFQERGIHTIRWDGRNDSGQQVSSGTYFIRIEVTWPLPFRLYVEEFTRTRKLCVVR